MTYLIEKVIHERGVEGSDDGGQSPRRTSGSGSKSSYNVVISDYDQRLSNLHLDNSSYFQTVKLDISIYSQSPS